jgi:glutathione peroxidase-family protein
LKEEAPGIMGTESIKWNFTKFLIDPEGNVAYNDFHVNRQKLIEFLKEQIA